MHFLCIREFAQNVTKLSLFDTLQLRFVFLKILLKVREALNAENKLFFNYYKSTAVHGKFFRHIFIVFF